MQYAFLGPRGTFTEEALVYYLKHKGMNINETPGMEPFSTIDKTLDACRTGTVDYALVPIENSLGGGVVTTTDYLTSHKGLFIIDEVYMPIRQYLWGTDECNGPEMVEEVISHPQALLQCHNYLKTYCHGATITEWPSTADAAREVFLRNDSRVVAIGGYTLGNRYNLQQIAGPIQDRTNNMTRFVVFSRYPNGAEETCHKTSVMCQLDGLRPGSLAEALGVISKRHINLVRIESRPNKNCIGEYVFFLDLLGNGNDANVRDALSELEDLATEYLYLGTYGTVNIP